MNIFSLFSLVLKGFILGLSMLLPGISGGTMAFIMGIYQKLIWEISKLQKKHLKSLLLCLKLKHSQFKKTAVLFLSTWDWFFLLPLIFGILLATALFVTFALPLIEQYRLPFYSIIFGLILASVFQPFREMKKTAKNLLLFMLSFVLNGCFFALGSDLPLSFGESGNLILLPAGFLISIALIIPGLSGSYLLVVFGMYENILLALKDLSFFTFFWFLTGMIVGIFSTAKVLNQLIKKHFNETMALILGLILGSLYAVYPLPKDSLQNLLTLDTQKQIFLFYALMSFSGFLIFSLFFKKTAKA